MQVLVCDDDASVRFAAKRVLEDTFGCTVKECGDGVEALTALGLGRYTFMLMDVDMPGMDGRETLEEIRASEQTRNLPVIILSHERREEVISALIKLGVSDYILKPLRPQTLAAKVETLVRMLPRTAMQADQLASIQLKHDSPALIVDGNLDFRFFFNSVMSHYGPIVMAESGAAGLAAFRRTPADLVFIGSDLGIMSPERLALKLRDLRPAGVRIIRIADEMDPDSMSDLYDGFVKRSFVPDTFRTSMRPYVFIPGPLSAASHIVPELPEMIGGVAKQVFGMMFESEIAPSSSEAELDVLYSSTLDVKLQDRFTVVVGIHLTKATAGAAAAKLLGMPADDLGDEDLESVTAELSNLLSGRLHARLRDRKLPSTIGLPNPHRGANYPKPNESNGLTQRLTMPGVGDFLLTLTVRDVLADGSGAGGRGASATTAPNTQSNTTADLPETLQEKVPA